MFYRIGSRMAVGAFIPCLGDGQRETAGAAAASTSQAALSGGGAQEQQKMVSRVFVILHSPYHKLVAVPLSFKSSAFEGVRNSLKPNWDQYKAFLKWRIN